MTIGASLFLIAIGAILRFAVTVHTNGFNVHSIGVILMVIGVIGLLLGLVLMTTRRRTDIVDRPGHTTIVEPNDPLDPRI
jgi:hypothetical protein